MNVCVSIVLWSKVPFINYVRVPREGGGLEKSLHTLTLWRGGVKLILT